MAASKKKTLAKAKRAVKPVRKSVKSVKKSAKSAAKPAKKSAAPKRSAKPNLAARAPKAVSALPKNVDKLVTPLMDRLLVFVEGPSETTASGLFIPGNASERPNRGKVLAKGLGRRNKKGQLRPLDVNVGDIVLFAQFAGTKLTLDGTEYLILREEDLLGIAT